MSTTKALTPGAVRAATFTRSLRQLADWYEDHPDLPLPYELEQPLFVFLYDLSNEEILRVLGKIGSFKKVFDEPDVGDFQALKTIGSFTLKFHTSRDKVCTPRVVGKRTIPETRIPAEPEQIISAREEDVVEWDCHPVLGKVAIQKAGVSNEHP